MFFTVTSTIYNIFIQSKTQQRYHIFTTFSEENFFYTMILHAYIGDYDKLPVCWDHNTDKHHDKYLPHKTTGIDRSSFLVDSEISDLYQINIISEFC